MKKNNKNFELIKDGKNRSLVKKYKGFIVFIIGAIIVYVGIPMMINFLFKCEAPTEAMVACWDAADMLSYIAGTLTFLGTMFLGWVSWNQNNRLQRIEANNFIAQNSCMVLLESMSFRSLDQLAVNFTDHVEPIVVEADLIGQNYGSFGMTIQMKRLDSYATLVRVESLTMFIGDQGISSYVFAKAYDDCYSRVAISDDMDRFELTVLIKKDTKQKAMEALQKNCTLMVDIVVELVTANYVVTKIKCRGTFFKDMTVEQMQKKFVLRDQKPICFWYGNEIIDSNTVEIRGEGIGR